MASFDYVTLWHFDEPLGPVWNEIADPLDWPSWWPGMERVEQITPGDERNVGAVHRYTVKGALPYRVSFDMRTTLVDEHQRIEGEATGEVVGRGVWTFGEERDGSRCHVRHAWSVQTTKAWMNFFAPVLRPLYAWNHDVVMRRGQAGLRALLVSRR